MKVCNLKWNRYKAVISLSIVSKNYVHSLAQRSIESPKYNEEQH